MTMAMHGAGKLTKTLGMAWAQSGVVEGSARSMAWSCATEFTSCIWVPSTKTTCCCISQYGRMMLGAVSGTRCREFMMVTPEACVTDVKRMT